MKEYEFEATVRKHIPHLDDLPQEEKDDIWELRAPYVYGSRITEVDIVFEFEDWLRCGASCCPRLRVR